jgi:hypothetical protein
VGDERQLVHLGRLEERQQPGRLHRRLATHPRHLHQARRHERGLGPNWDSLPVAAWNTLAAYYPGDNYVDWVALSGYSDGRRTPDTLFGSFYQQFAQRKPMMIAETSVRERGGTVKAEWINKLRSWIVAHPNTRALIWFDTNNETGENPDWRIDTSQPSLAAFQALAQDPKFQG